MKVEWDKLFEYSNDSPSSLVNKIDRPPRAVAGTPAGYQRDDGYWLIGHKGKNVLVHRIVFEMFNEKITEGKEVDHIDGNPSNNSITNLRLLDKIVNQRNMKMNVRNSSGFSGVVKTIVQRPNKRYEYWTACWEENEVSKRVNFSISKYGYDVALSNAVKAREDAITRLNTVGAGYTERHGK